MPGPTDSPSEGKPLWHAQAGDMLDDNYNMPGIVLCALGVVAVACTLAAAGYGYAGWTQLGAIVTALLWSLGIGALVVEHRREELIELRYGRQGHAPGGLRPVHYSAARTPDA
ncbi:hypothetical protein [Nocardia sp. NPDC050793]|uniref:hypothetical protein n=1 Tax=Nocardia sp. NPDC050793 TaxID=3155159 RepID=UPI0033E412D5